MRCACCVGFCTVWWYLVFVCWRGGSFCLLRRLLSSMPRWSASVLDALIGEPTRCCAGNGADEYSRASLERDPVTRPSLRKPGNGECVGRCVCLQSEHRGEGRRRVRSRVLQTREDPDQARRVQDRANSRPFSRQLSTFSSGDEVERDCLLSLCRTKRRCLRDKQILGTVRAVRFWCRGATGDRCASRRRGGKDSVKARPASRRGRPEV